MAISGATLKRMELTLQQSMQVEKEQSIANEAVDIKIVKDKQSFAKLEKPWAALLERSGNSNLYLSHDWLYTWWHWFGEQSSSELSIICIYLNQSLIAVAPFYMESKYTNLMRTKKTLRLLGQSEESDTIPDCEQLDIITDDNQQDVVLNTLVACLQKNAPFSRFIFHAVAKQSVLFRLVNLLSPSQSCCLNIQEQALSVVLPSSFDTFISAQTFTWRIHYRGNKRKMNMTGDVEIRKYRKPDEIHAGLQSLTQILCTQQRKASGGKCSFDGERYMRFHEEICHLLSMKNRVEIVSLVMDGRLLASVCYCRTDSEAIQIYQMASVRGDGIRFSPMLLLMTHVIEQSIEAGCQRIDFLSSCIHDKSGKECIKDKSTELYTLEWYKNRGLAYFVNLTRKFL